MREDIVVLLLDTDSLPPSQRNDALTALISEASGPTEVSHDVDDELISNKTDFWNVGSSNGLIRVRDNSVRFKRSAHQVRSNDRDLFAVTVQLRGNGLILEGKNTVVQRPMELSLHRVAREHEFAFQGIAENASFLLGRNDLGLPLSRVVNAAPNLRSSPVYGLVQTHFMALCAAAHDVAANAAASELLASATVQMVRALLASLDSADRHSRDVLHESAFTVVAAYIQNNLNDLSLDARQVAAANFLTERQLNAIWPREEPSIADWILHARLLAAKKDLEGSSSSSLDIVARRWGFSTRKDFEARFVQAFGYHPHDIAGLGFRAHT